MIGLPWLTAEVPRRETPHVGGLGPSGLNSLGRRLRRNRRSHCSFATLRPLQRGASRPVGAYACTLLVCSAGTSTLCPVETAKRAARTAKPAATRPSFLP